MCVKEFLGYICGHCSVPELRRCPLSMQAAEYPACSMAAERPIATNDYCPACGRIVWNAAVLAREEEHKQQHLRGECACGINFGLGQDDTPIPNQHAVVQHGLQKERRLRPRPGGGRNRRPDSAFEGTEYSEENGGQEGSTNSRPISQHQEGIHAYPHAGYPGPGGGGWGNNHGYGHTGMDGGVHVDQHADMQSFNSQQMQPVYVHETLLSSQQHNYHGSTLDMAESNPDSRISETGRQYEYVGYRTWRDQPVEYTPRRYPDQHHNEASRSQAHGESSSREADYNTTYDQPSMIVMTRGDTADTMTTAPTASARRSATQKPTANPLRHDGFQQPPTPPNQQQFGDAHSTSESPLGTRAFTNAGTSSNTKAYSSQPYSYEPQQDPSSQFDFSLDGQNYSNHEISTTFQPYGFGSAGGMKWNPETSGSQRPVPPAHSRGYNNNNNTRWQNAIYPPRGPRVMRRERQRGAQSEAVEAANKRMSDLEIGECSSHSTAGAQHGGKQQVQDREQPSTSTINEYKKIPHTSVQEATNHHEGESRAHHNDQTWEMIEYNNGESAVHSEFSKNAATGQEHTAQNEDRGNEAAAAAAAASNAYKDEEESEHVLPQPVVVSSSMYRVRRGSA